MQFNIETALAVKGIGYYVFQGFVFWCLVYYSIHRRFKAEKPGGLIEYIDRFRIEIIAAAVLIPQWAEWLPKLFSGG